MKEHKEKFLLQCALADLQGALQAHESMDRLGHDWAAHAQTIEEIEDALRRTWERRVR
jgi:predicted phosphohydrolase